jgi:hypothetical protein
VPEPNSKGINFVSVRSYILERYGGDAWARILAALDANDRATMESVVAVGWYPTALLLHLIDVAESLLDESKRTFRKSMARRNAETQLRVIHRAFLRLASPAYVLEKAGDYWGRFHDQGTWRVERGDGWTRATLEGFVAQEGFCTQLTAYIERLFELVGARDVHFEHRHCRARGDTACVFLGRWRT